MRQLQEIVITGGMPDGTPFSVAHIPGSAATWRRRPAETEAAFRDRVRREAGDVRCIVFDGLPA